MSARVKLATAPSSSSTQPHGAVVRATAHLALAAVASAASQLCLSPVYGAIPASIWHQRAVVAVAMGAVITKATSTRLLSARAVFWLPVLAFWIPPIQRVLFQYSSVFGPVYGPVATEAVTVFPLLLLSMYSAVVALDALDFSRFSSTVAEMIPPLACYTTFTAVEKLVSGALPALMGTNEFFTRSGLQFLVAAGSAALSPSKLLLLALPALFHTARLDPHFPGAATTAVLNRTLQANSYTLLERHESLTGYVSVLESFENQFRLLRCDHSLLGGEWLVTPQRRRSGQTQPETIYTVFTMLEAVRLVRTGAVNAQRPDSAKSALNIGLGIGTAPSALIAHGINTTIVELDPAVHRMATKYFRLPSNHTAVLRDAVPYVASTAQTSPDSFDYIIHDVFTGGAEPAALFTQEFLSGLKALLRPDGVVAINYAGDLRLPTTRMVVNTIHAVFPSCRIFRDQAPPEQAADADAEQPMDFINMILFCRRTPSPITFRQPVEADFLDSIVRRRTLHPARELEVKFTPDVDAQLLTGETVGVLEAGHRESAVSHWRIMRQVLPDKIWELW